MTHDGVELSWSAPEHNGLTGYRILRGSDADSLETIVEDTGDLALSYTDTTAADDATHHYAVVALRTVPGRALIPSPSMDGQP